MERIVEGVLLKPAVILGGKLSLLVPDGFTVMDDEKRRLKYPNENRPSHIYTNERGSVNVTTTYKSARVLPPQLDAVRESMEAGFRNLQPTATWFESGMTTINGREWLIVDVRAPTIDTEVRNVIVGTSLEGRLLLVTVNVTKELEEKWIAPLQAVFQSLHAAG